MKEFQVDFEDVYRKWIAFFTLSVEDRREMLELLHPEVQKGFDVITRIAKEETDAQCGEILKSQFSEFQNNLEFTFAILAYGGYFLFLIEHSIDPTKGTLPLRKTTDFLGSQWIQEIRKNPEDVIPTLQISPVILGFLNILKADYVNRFMMVNLDILSAPYFVFGTIEKFFFWTLVQGYRLGMMEEKLKK